ncbi:MAG TPA: DUF4838 domain-containing protein, partial [Sumerlaeia bacterium]|nr:DUF4838 domain-containing protein [Sumerlaeia bacterium]
CTGALLPIVDEKAAIKGPRILVGESAATRELGLRADDFAPQEYAIRFLPDTIVLIGRDWIDTPENRREAGRGAIWDRTLDSWRETIDYDSATGREGAAQRIELPGIFDDQGTCYAAYDFLERFLGVRWYGPSPINTVAPKSRSLAVAGADVRRAPALKYRRGYGGKWPIVRAQWDDASEDALTLYRRRIREGGEKWAGNHSFTSFQDRFRKKKPKAPDLFKGARPEYFAQSQEGDAGTLQFCYTNPEFIAQLVKDAREYFDGKGLRGNQLAMGDYFAVVPLDNSSWCQCDRCQAALARGKDNYVGGHFNNGRASYYLFSFVNAIAREVRKTHPDKYIATLAYADYFFKPTEFELEPNVSVAPCLQVRNYWAPRIREHEMRLYKQWVTPRDRPIHLWNYYCFPTEQGVVRGFNVFPGFYVHTLAELIKMYAQDGVRGVFLCGIGEQVDFYFTMKMYDDPSIDIDAALDEFFRLYFGAAAEPMKKFYLRIEEIYSDPKNYPEDVRTQDNQFHQNEEMAWEWLGTKERMRELGALMDQAVAAARTDVEKRRVETWKKGVWDYMKTGAERYYAKQELRKQAGPIPALTVPRVAPLGDAPDLASLDWTKGAELKGWKQLEGFSTDRRVEGRILHDGRRLYVRLTEHLDTSALSDAEGVYNGDDWEILFAAERGETWNQFACNPSGKVIVGGWALDEEVVSRVEPDRWILLLAIPLRKLLPGGVKPGAAFYANFYRATTGGIPRELLAWSANYEHTFLTTKRMGEFTLAD